MKPERRIVHGGTYYGDGDADRAAAVYQEGMRLISEARARYGLSRRDGLSARRLADGTIVVSNIRRAAPQHPADELLDARAELLQLKAQALR